MYIYIYIYKCIQIKKYILTLYIRTCLYTKDIRILLDTRYIDIQRHAFFINIHTDYTYV